MPFDFIFVPFFYFAIQEKKKNEIRKGNSNISHVFVYIFCVFGSIHMCANWTLIYLNITFSIRESEAKKENKTLPAHAHIIERKQILFFSFLHFSFYNMQRRKSKCSSNHIKKRAYKHSPKR